MWGDLNHEFEVGAIGTGVAIGDYDGDGRPDIYVVSKTEGCRLFRNLGGYKFEDVTQKAGVGATPGIWNQGATFVDINNNGLLDIYVCRFNAPNLLYINQGDGTFKEMAHAYGLDVNDASSMAAFCDYDRDGWLDVFIQTNILSYARAPERPEELPLPQQPQRHLHQCHGARGDLRRGARAFRGVVGLRQRRLARTSTWPTTSRRRTCSTATTATAHSPTSSTRRSRTRPSPRWARTWATSPTTGSIDLFVTDMAATTHEKDQRGMADSRSRTTEDDAQPGQGAAVRAQRPLRQHGHRALPRGGLPRRPRGHRLDLVAPPRGPGQRRPPRPLRHERHGAGVDEHRPHRPPVGVRHRRRSGSGSCTTARSSPRPTSPSATWATSSSRTSAPHGASTRRASASAPPSAT